MNRKKGNILDRVTKKKSDHEVTIIGITLMLRNHLTEIHGCCKNEDSI